MALVSGQVPTAAELNAITTDINAVVRAWYATAGGIDQTGISAVADATGYSVTWTADPTRLYRIHCTMCIQKVTTANAVTAYITDASNTGIQASSVTLAINDLAMVVISKVQTGLSGSTTRKIRLETASGTVSVVNSFSRNGQLIVEDIGPA